MAMPRDEDEGRTRPQDPGAERDAPVWAGARNRPGAPNAGEESDVPEGEREATRAEVREAAEKSFDHPGGGERGDLGDSGPGED
jgi:hypothetical protein